MDILNNLIDYIKDFIYGKINLFSPETSDKYTKIINQADKTKSKLSETLKITEKNKSKIEEYHKSKAIEKAISVNYSKLTLTKTLLKEARESWVQDNRIFLQDNKKDSVVKRPPSMPMIEEIDDIEENEDFLKIKKIRRNMKKRPVSAPPK